MSKSGWHREPKRHSLASRGIKTSSLPRTELPSREKYISDHMKYVQSIEEMKEVLANSDSECYFIESVSDLSGNVDGFHLFDGPFTDVEAKSIEDMSLFPGMYQRISRTDAMKKYGIPKNHWIPLPSSGYGAAHAGAEDRYDEMKDQHDEEFAGNWGN